MHTSSYNSELWCMNAKSINTVDAFQRIFLCQILNVTTKDLDVTDLDLYQKCQSKLWSTIILTKRLRFLGHILRQNSQIPMRKALDEYFRPVLRDRGRPPTTQWFIIKKDLKSLGISLDIKKLEKLAQNRDQWKELGRRAISNQDRMRFRRRRHSLMDFQQ